MKNELIIFAAAIALLAGCSKEEGAPAAERPCIRLSTGVEAATRATDVAFEEGDNFGLRCRETITLFLSTPSARRATVAEMVPQVPGQMNMDGTQQEAPKLLKLVQHG